MKSRYFYNQYGKGGSKLDKSGNNCIMGKG